MILPLNPIRLLVPAAVVLALLMSGGCCTDAQTSTAGTCRQANWVAASGGVSACPVASARLQRACDPVLKAAGLDVRIHVLDAARPGAWSWPSGDVYASAALVSMLSDAELAAVVGHEVGHLILDGHAAAQVAGHVALASPASNADVEAEVDAIARRLLLASGLDTSAMRTAIEKLSAHPATDITTRRALRARIDKLR